MEEKNYTCTRTCAKTHSCGSPEGNKKRKDMRAVLEVALDKETEVSALQSKIHNREEDVLFQNSYSYGILV